LTAEDRAILAGETGQAAALAMRVILAMAAAQGAERLIEVTRGHVDGCIYAHDANLIFAETMAEMGARVAIPTTINAISVDRESRCDLDLPRAFSEAANRLADAYLRMGAQPTFTCAPYLSPTPPRRGEAIGWSESNAVIFANSVLGARTAKHPDHFDLFVAMTGRAPESGMYLAAARRPGVVIDIDMPTSHDDAIWPLLGWVAGRLAPDRVPLLRGLEAAAPGRDDLRAMCAAFGTTSAAPMLHVAGVTPESDLDPIPAARRVQVTRRDLAEAWHALNAGPECIDLVALGSPHFSLEETRAFAGVMAGARIGSGVRVIITLGRDVRAEAEREGLLDRLQSLGVRVHSDLCWCSMVEPIFPETARAVMTNSGKYAHYAPGLSGRGVRFGSLADCAAAAQSGRAPTEPPEWLR
ncbi:MAG: aconitase X catalytic domain-containing protein, partial [Pseudomonadota bacterium]